DAVRQEPRRRQPYEGGGHARARPRAVGARARGARAADARLGRGGRMDSAVTSQPAPPASRVVELTQRAESLGFTHAWTFDSHILWQEPYVIYSQMLAATERIMVGPLVTHPATRDPHA